MTDSAQTGSTEGGNGVAEKAQDKAKRVASQAQDKARETAGRRAGGYETRSTSAPHDRAISSARVPATRVRSQSSCAIRASRRRRAMSSRQPMVRSGLAAICATATATGF